MPVTDWGKDHWSTLAYVECRAVDNGGALNPQHMRGHLGRRPEQYPTRLRDGIDLEGHDDYDCVADAVEAGFLEAAGKHGSPGNARYSYRDHTDRMVLTHRYTLTDKGAEVTAALRKHKAMGGNFAGFVWQDSVTIEPTWRDVTWQEADAMATAARS